MRLVKDYVHEFEGLWEEKGKCRIRIYKDNTSPMVIICSELSDNQGGSITTIVERLAGEIWHLEGEPDPFVWIEHSPAILSATNKDTFHWVTFAHIPESGFQSPQWEELTREEAEKLVGGSIGSM